MPWHGKYTIEIGYNTNQLFQNKNPKFKIDTNRHSRFRRRGMRRTPNAAHQCATSPPPMHLPHTQTKIVFLVFENCRFFKKIQTRKTINNKRTSSDSKVANCDRFGIAVCDQHAKQTCISTHEKSKLRMYVWISLGDGVIYRCRSWLRPWSRQISRQTASMAHLLPHWSPISTNSKRSQDFISLFSFLFLLLLRVQVSTWRRMYTSLLQLITNTKTKW